MYGHRRDDNIVEDFCDTVHAKVHPLFGKENSIATTAVL